MSVDGVQVQEMGLRVDPATAIVHVDGARINVRDDLVYLALNKPRGVLSAMSDDRGRKTVGDLVADRSERLFHVGRLDADSEGLLLLTNDGELAHRLMHPSFGVSKTYLATVPAPIGRTVARQLRDGVDLDDGPVRVDSFRVVQTSASGPSSRWCCTRVASTSCGACSTPSVTRCSVWCGPRSGRYAWAGSGPGACASSRARSSRACIN